MNIVSTIWIELAIASANQSFQKKKQAEGVEYMEFPGVSKK